VTTALRLDKIYCILFRSKSGIVDVSF